MPMPRARSDGGRLSAYVSLVASDCISIRLYNTEICAAWQHHTACVRKHHTLCLRIRKAPHMMCEKAPHIMCKN